MLASPFARPLYMMAKPVGAACNLACRYCYYLEKSRLYRSSLPRERLRGGEHGSGMGSGHVSLMSDEVLEHFVQQYLEAQTNSEVLFTWHGGEPLLQSMSFYERAMRLQRRYAAGRHVDNCLQTNGTLLTDEWCRFFRDNGWLVGVSIDGPEHLHDAYRRNRGGEGTFQQVMRGIERLERHGVMWNALCTVNALTVEHPEAVYRFFRSIGSRYLQFTPVGRHSPIGPMGPMGPMRPMSPIGPIGPMSPISPISPTFSDSGSVAPPAWGRFLCRLFDEWKQADVGEVFVNIFEATLANYMGVTPGMCALSALCGHVGVVEWNGDVYSCDHFVFPEHYLGNLREKTLYEMMHSEQQQTFARQKRDLLPPQCKACRWLFTCHGECPRNRQYLCEGYRQYFEHVDSFMKQMRDSI